MSTVLEQIEGACAFVRKHRSLRPVIAGNALWCWAANQLARDVVMRWYLELNAGGTPHSDDEIERVRALVSKEKRQCA